METKATVVENVLPVRFLRRPEFNQDHLTVSVPNGWDDVKTLCKKVLEFDGRYFTFTGWNSDRNEAFFVAPLGGSADVAKIRRRV